ncbi:MAG: DUF2190 family protein [Magnetococcales bacterium]|nr:DUF2190 family protein [Magnetococcales bacterium]
MSYQEGVGSFVANGALTRGRRVKATAASSTRQVEVAGAGEQHIGVVEYDAADGANVAVRMRNHNGTHFGVAADSFAVGAVLYGAAAGKLSDSSSGSAIGVAISAAGADGDIVEWAPYTTMSTTAGGVSIADAGSFTDTATVEAALQELYQNAVTAQGFIPVPLTNLLETDATNIVGRLLANTTPTLDLKNGDTDSALRVSWAASNSDPVIFQVPLPPDIDDAASLVVHFRAAMAGATDTPVIAGDMYCNEGDTKVEANSGAVTGTGYVEYTITMGASDVPSGAQTFTCELTPGAHTTDALYLTALSLEYTKKIMTS